MVIIYGHRAYGRVDEWGGEYAQTSFAHVYYMPLFPTGSMWVTREVQGSRLGLPIGLHLKSVGAAYLRTWGIVAAILTFGFAPGLVTGIVALALGALSVYSWSWRTLRGGVARQRSDFNLLAYGTRCEPVLVAGDTRTKLAAALEERRARLPEQRPVEDIARFGAASLDEAVVAYGLLRLAALEHRDAHADAAADRLLAGSHDQLPEGDGPYRQVQAADAASPQAQVAQLAAFHTAQVHAAPGTPGSGFWSLPGMKLIVVACLALFSIGMIAANSEAVFGCDEATLSQLESAPPYFRYVSVACDRVEAGGDIVDPKTGRPSDSVFFCRLGSRTLVVTADPSETALATRIEGRVQKTLTARWTWPAELRDDPAVLQLYLDTKGHANDLAWAIAGIVAAAAALGLGGFWLVRYVRRRRSR